MGQISRKSDLAFWMNIIYFIFSQQWHKFWGSAWRGKNQGPRGWESNLPHFRAVFTNCIQWFINSCPNKTTGRVHYSFGLRFLPIQEIPYIVIGPDPHNVIGQIVTKPIQYNACQIGIDMQIYRLCAFSTEKDAARPHGFSSTHGGGGRQHGCSSLGCILDLAFRLNFIIQISLFIMWNKMYQSIVILRTTLRHSVGKKNT